jgi:uncharacterized protein involved in outer membrane biogenesis
MAEANVSSSAPRKPRGGLRIISVILGVLVVLLIVVYFVATSSAFFKGFILPKVSKSLNAQITVADASISPFSQVVLHDLKVQTVGPDPLVTAPEVRLRYSLMDIIRGHINIDEVTLTSPTIVLVQNPDGTSNLDPILKSQKKPSEPSKPSPSKPMEVNIKKVSLTDGTIRQIKLYKGNHREVTELSHVNVSLDNLQNGQTAKLTLSSDMKMDNNPPAPGTNGMLQAKLNGNFNLALAPDLKPSSIQGNTRFDVTRAEGSLAQASALSANLDCDITPTDIKQLALRFQRANTPLGEMRASGPFNMEKMEGRISVQVLNIDKNLLNIAGASSGIDFGPTTITSTNTIQLSNAGNAIAASGQLNLRQFQLTRTNQTTPPLDLSANYDLAVDRAASNATVRAFTVSGTQRGNQLLHGELTSPMVVSWGNTANAVGDSALNLVVTHLDLADWKPFVGELAPAGVVNAKLQLLSQQAGKQLTFDASSDIANLTVGAGSNQITQAAFSFHLKGKASDLNQFDLSDYSLSVARQNQPCLTASGSGTYNKASEIADLQLKAEVLLARLLEAFPRPDVKLSSGTINVTAHVTQKQKQQGITGNLTLADLTGQFGNNLFQSFGLTSDLDIGMNPDQVQIRRFAGKLTQAKNPGGAFDLSGTYSLNNKISQLTAKLIDFNQNGLRPFLEPMLSDKKLTSVALNGNASVQYDPNATSSVKADLQVTNLVVNDPKGQLPATALAAKCQLDAALNKKVADIRQCQLALTPTARAANTINLTGHLDTSNTNATQGNLKLAADALDLTTYYDLFAGGQKTGGAASSPAPQPASHPGSTTPTAPDTQTNQLPLRNFTLDATVGRLFLREVDIANFQATTKIDGGHVVVNPFKLSLNGAPVNSTIDVDLGVPGYKYDLAFGAKSVPLAPLVNTFQPERKGQLGGTFTANANFKGVGTSGASLQKTLAGQFDMASTNLNLSVADVKDPRIKLIINVVATLPELVKNPESAIGSLVQSFSGKSNGSLTDELSKSPINAILANGNAGSGKVNLQNASIQSSAFRADANGTITLAPVLTNSPIQIPVAVWLGQSVAKRLNMVSANTPTNAPYVKLPDFLTETGTLGDPKAQYNKQALLSLAAKGLGALHIGGTAGNIIQGLGNLGGGSGTNQSTNKTSGLLQGLGGLLGGNAAGNTNNSTNATTNTAATNQPAANQQPTINNLLNDLLKPKEKPANNK